MGQLKYYQMPYRVELTETHIREKHIEWLQQTIGGYKELWQLLGPHQIAFLRESDRMLFALRWT